MEKQEYIEEVNLIKEQNASIFNAVKSQELFSIKIRTQKYY